MVLPRPTLAEALSSPAFEAALPKLVAYAARAVRRAGWGEGRDQIPSAVEAEDVLHDAIEACLDGTRTWPEDMALETYLCGVMWSQVSHLRRDAARWDATCLDDVAEPAAPSSRRDRRHDARRMIAAVEQTLMNDPETYALFTMIVDGEEKPTDYAAALGWTPERAKTVRVRMNRRLAAAGLCEGDDDEQPRSHRSPRPGAAPPGRARGRAAG